MALAINRYKTKPYAGNDSMIIDESVACVDCWFVFLDTNNTQM